MQAEFESLRDHLAQWDRRRRTRQVLRLLPRAISAALLLALGLALVARLRPLLTRTELTFVAAGLVALVAGVLTLVVLLRRRDLAGQARFADRQFGLRERAITAVELQTGRLQTTPEMHARQIADAATAAGRVDAERQMPLTIDRREAVVAAALLALLLAAIWLPNLQEALLLRQRNIASTIAGQSEAIGQAAEAIASNEALTPEQREALSAPLEEAQAALDGGDLSQEQALATLGETEQQLRQLSESLSADALRRSLETGATALANTEASAALGEALQQGDLSAAAAEAQALAGELGTMDEATHDALAESLEATAGALAGSDPALAEQLQAAADALASGDEAAAAEALDGAADQLAERDQQATAAQAAEGAARQLGAARAEVAAAGTDAGQTGEAGPAQAGEPSAGEGSGETSEAAGDTGGEGAGPATAGAGQGNATDGQQGGPGSGSTSTGGPGPGGGRAENIFAPGAADLSGFQGTDIELPAECLGDPASCGPLVEEQAADPELEEGGSLVPYTQVYGDYRDAAYETLEGAPIPPGLKAFVREYFTSLQP
jgi:hypothetical protein